MEIKDAMAPVVMKQIIMVMMAVIVMVRIRVGDVTVAGVEVQEPVELVSKQAIIFENWPSLIVDSLWG